MCVCVCVCTAYGCKAIKRMEGIGGIFGGVYEGRVGGEDLFIDYMGVTALAKRGKTFRGRKKDAFPVGVGREDSELIKIPLTHSFLLDVPHFTTCAKAVGFIYNFKHFFGRVAKYVSDKEKQGL